MNVSASIAELNHKLDFLEANPHLRAEERHKEYYAYSSVHGGNLLKEHALIVCASVDEDAPEYKTLVQPLIKRIETFFAHPSHVLDFSDEVRMQRARRLIEQGQYEKAERVYLHIPYGPMFAKSYEQRNHYFLNSAKNHFHLIKKLTHPSHIKQQLLSMLRALQYVHAYPYTDDISVYQIAEAIFSQNYYNDAKIMVEKICTEFLPDYLNHLTQTETIVVYTTLLSYKHEISQWPAIVKMLQKHFIALLFKQQQFQRPDEMVITKAHDLLNEPTSSFERLQHMVGKTSLEKNFLAALIGNQVAVQQLRQFL